MRFDSGPLGELVVTRDTGGGFVLSGLSYFPDGTRLSVVLYDSLGKLLGRTQPVVERAMFRSLPILPPSAGPAGAPGGWPGGRYAVEINATFAGGMQSSQVLRQARSGGSLRGAGMTRTIQGDVAYSRRFQVRL